MTRGAIRRISFATIIVDSPLILLLLSARASLGLGTVLNKWSYDYRCGQFCDQSG